MNALLLVLGAYTAPAAMHDPASVARDFPASGCAFYATSTRTPLGSGRLVFCKGPNIAVAHEDWTRAGGTYLEILPVKPVTGFPVVSLDDMNWGACGPCQGQGSRQGTSANFKIDPYPGYVGVTIDDFNCNHGALPGPNPQFECGRLGMGAGPLDMERFTLQTWGRPFSGPFGIAGTVAIGPTALPYTIRIVNFSYTGSGYVGSVGDHPELFELGSGAPIPNPVIFVQNGTMTQPANGCCMTAFFYMGNLNPPTATHITLTIDHVKMTTLGALTASTLVETNGNVDTLNLTNDSLSAAGSYFPILIRSPLPARINLTGSTCALNGKPLTMADNSKQGDCGSKP